VGTAWVLGHCLEGLQELIGNKGETSPFTLIRNCRLLRYDSNSGKNDGRCFLILYDSPGCQTLSKAWLTSKNTDVQYSGRLDDHSVSPHSH